MALGAASGRQSAVPQRYAACLADRFLLAGTRERLQLLTSTPTDGRTCPAFELAPSDGIAVIKFVREASLNAEFGSDHYRKAMAPDEARSTDTTSREQ